MKISTLQLAKTRMISEHLLVRGITDKRVINAMTLVPREFFLPQHLHHLAYEDIPLPIGENQNISRPYIVALMCQLLELKGKETVLDIGSGSGYQAAVLSFLAKEVVSVEHLPSLHILAKTNLKKLKIKNVKVVFGNEAIGYQKKSPYDAIKSSVYSDKIPEDWIKQLKNKGRIVTPPSPGLNQNLLRFTKQGKKILKEDWSPVKFTPLIREENILI